jgi:uncharacterized protein (UPF0332 family)
MAHELRTNVQTFLKSAELVWQEGDFTSATMLYFKALFVAYDYLLLLRASKAPQDHTERFQLLRRYFPEEYELLDRYFAVYRSTYTSIIDKQTAGEIRDYVKKNHYYASWNLKRRRSLPGRRQN